MSPINQTMASSSRGKKTPTLILRSLSLNGWEQQVSKSEKEGENAEQNMDRVIYSEASPPKIHRVTPNVCFELEPASSLDSNLLSMTILTQVTRPSVFC